MNRIAERIVPVMNDDELQGLVISNYEQDAQTLTRDSESNVLKFKELMEILTPEETKRWESIKYAYTESVKMQGIEGEDTAAQVLRSISGLRDGLESIRRTIADATDGKPDEQTKALQTSLARVGKRLSMLGGQVTEAINSSTERLANASQESPEQKVLVQHSVPRVMTDLVQSQFQLLYDGLRPVLENSALTSTQLDRLRTSIEECLKDYKDLQEEIDSAKE